MNRSTGTTDDFAGSGGKTDAPAAQMDDPAGTAFRHAPTAMLVADRAGAVLLVNQAFTTLLGYSPTEVAGRHWPELFETDDHGRAWEQHSRALRGSAPGQWPDLAIRTARGRSHRTVVQARPLPSTAAADEVAGVVVQLSAVSRDEETLRIVTELRLREADTALWSLDLTSGRLSELFGPSPLGRMLAGEACTLEECLARVHRDDVARLRDALETSYQGRDYEQRFRMFDQVGDERWLYARGAYVGGERPRLVGVVDDMTEHVELVRRLADRRRIEAAQGRQVNELAAKLVSATTVEEVTDLLGREFLPIFGGDSAHVMLLDQDELRLHSTRTANVERWLEEHDHRDVSYPTGAVLQDRQPRFFESRSELLGRFPAVEGTLRRTGSHSWAFVPVFGDAKVTLGVWVVAWTQPHHATPDERALMLTLAGLAGQALQRVNRQRAELELADAVQKRMLPPQPPDFPELDVAVRYLPSRAGWRVCGDFYDAIRLPGSRIGLVVGDVQGHGVEAAAAMGQIRMAFRAYASNQSDPGTVLAETNRLLTETGEIVFATCGYLVIDVDLGQIQAAWAGQPPVVLATGSGYEVWSPETGPPVGVDSEAKYPVSSRSLPPGSTLLMCSDGLVESSEVNMDDGLAAVGRELDAKAADVHQAATALARLTPAGRSDDIAILVARVR
ncbi:SpoIIE family protein phosphatase [Thermobifida halotolerans]|uniref:SpoIIE family protein phosphatase n=1 Tax=Thermobifida halotolerans TaxID=483545 RepID=UPI0008384FF1